MLNEFAVIILLLSLRLVIVLVFSVPHSNTSDYIVRYVLWITMQIQANQPMEPILISRIEIKAYKLHRPFIQHLYVVCTQ